MFDQFSLNDNISETKLCLTGIPLKLCVIHSLSATLPSSALLIRFGISFLGTLRHKPYGFP